MLAQHIPINSISKLLFFCVLISLSINSFSQITPSYGKSNPSYDENCDRIDYVPCSSKPDFNTMLAGVKYAVITNRPESDDQIIAISALKDYLLAIGFEGVASYLDDFNVSTYNSIVLVELNYTYQSQYFYDIHLTFGFEQIDYTWNFTTKRTVKAVVYSDAHYNLGLAYRDMYNYIKPKFNEKYTLSFQKKLTCWTEGKLKADFQTNGASDIEGIYENTSANSTKYKVWVRKIQGIYYLIYLSGANNYGDWKEGEIKATLEPTATHYLFKAKWIMSNKSEDDSYYISFEKGFFNLIKSGENDDMYIKMYPLSNVVNSNQTKSSGTGFAISSDGYIVTNYHVTNGSTTIKVRGINGDFSKFYVAKVILEDKNNDLAIIKIDDPNFTSLGTIPYVISNQPTDVGSSIFVLGYPMRATMGDEVKLTNGIISSTTGYQGDITSYQTSAPVQPGNSGGPLFNSEGKVVGVINAKHSNAENASYAIKSNYLITLIQQLQPTTKLQTVSIISGKPLTEQIKIVKKFVYIIEINN